jgi:hypothetical protein
MQRVCAACWGIFQHWYQVLLLAVQKQLQPCNVTLCKCDAHANFAICLLPLLQCEIWGFSFCSCPYGLRGPGGFDAGRPVVVQ